MKVEWIGDALQDLELAYEYISRHSLKAAHKIIERVESGIVYMKAYPHIGKKGRAKDTRELVIPDTPFVLIYRVKETHIEIIAFLHGRRKWP